MSNNNEDYEVVNEIVIIIRVNRSKNVKWKYEFKIN